jgi:hypothetical protein
MLFRRCLVVLACGLLTTLGVLLQTAPGVAVLNACRWLERWSGACPSWVSERNIPPAAPWVCYAMAGLGLLFVISSLVSGLFVQRPEATLAQFIQRGRDLHERCRKEGDQAVRPMRSRNSCAGWVIDTWCYLAISAASNCLPANTTPRQRWKYVSASSG